MNEKLMRAVALLRASKLRWSILSSTQNIPKTKTDLQRETGVKLSNVSVEVTFLEKEGLIQCLTPDVKRGKLYKATELADEAFQEDLRIAADSTRREGERKREEIRRKKDKDTLPWDL